MPGKLGSVVAMIILVAGFCLVGPGTAASRCMLAEFFSSTS